MKIVFFGTPDFAVSSLKILHENGYQVVGVVTAPPKKAGRGLQLKEPPVKQYADSIGLPTLQPEKLSDPSFVDQLQKLKGDLFVVVAFRMLPELVWQMPERGTFNLHASLLPDYRGAAPINRVLMNGETRTGVTTFFLKHAIDTGNIIFREELPVGENETAGELHDRLMETGAQLVLRTVSAIAEGNVKAVVQEEFMDEGTSLHSAPKIYQEDCRINWNRSADVVHNQVRGLSPFPGAFTVLEDENGKRMQMKILRSLKTEQRSSGTPGTLSSDKNRLFIRCGDAPLEITHVQLEGKKSMMVSEFLKGFRPEKNWKCISGN